MFDVFFILKILSFTLQIFLPWNTIRCACIVKINTRKIGKILKVESNLSLLKLMYLSYFVSDLSKLGLKIYVRVFSIEIKRKFDNRTDAICSVVHQTFHRLFFSTGGGGGIDIKFGHREIQT